MCPWSSWKPQGLRKSLLVLKLGPWPFIVWACWEKSWHPYLSILLVTLCKKERSSSGSVAGVWPAWQVASRPAGGECGPPSESPIYIYYSSDFQLCHLWLSLMSHSSFVFILFWRAAFSFFLSPSKGTGFFFKGTKVCSMEIICNSRSHLEVNNPTTWSSLSAYLNFHLHRHIICITRSCRAVEDEAIRPTQCCFHSGYSVSCFCVECPVPSQRDICGQSVQVPKRGLLLSSPFCGLPWKLLEWSIPLGHLADLSLFILFIFQLLWSQLENQENCDVYKMSLDVPVTPYK